MCPFRVVLCCKSFVVNGAGLPFLVTPGKFHLAICCGHTAQFLPCCPQILNRFVLPDTHPDFPVGQTKLAKQLPNPKLGCREQRDMPKQACSAHDQRWLQGTLLCSSRTLSPLTAVGIPRADSPLTANDGERAPGGNCSNLS